MIDEQYTRHATDPHEDRWSRLAVSSRKEDLKAASSDVHDKLDDYIAFSRHNISSGVSLQNQAYKDASKQDDKLKNFNQRILREFEDLKRSKYYPGQNYRFPVSNEPLVSGFIVNPEQISPLLKTSEERIKALEREMDHRERDALKMSGVVDLLIEENKYLRDHISAKNRDINKILETVGLNDGETTHDLRHRITLLSEENNILLAHLEELRAVKDNFERFSREKNNEIARATEDYEQVRRSLEEALRREEILANFKQTIDPRFRASQDKVAELESQVSDLIEELSTAKNQNNLISNQLASYKKNFEEVEGRNSMEVDRLVQEVNILQNEKKELKKVIESKDKAIEDRQNEIRKLRRDFEQTRLEFEEVVQVMNEQKNNLANERQTSEGAVKKEKELKERNNLLADEVEKLQTKLKIAEDDHARAADSLKADYNIRISELEQKAQKSKSKLESREREHESEIAHLKSQSEELARILESVSAEREEYLRKYGELSMQEQTFKGREVIIQELQGTAERLQREADRYQNELADTERRYRAQVDDLRSESNKLAELNKELKEEVQSLKADGGVGRNGGIYQSTIENTRESPRRRTHVNDVSATGKSFVELEKENEYLHQMIKNLVQNNENPQRENLRTSPSRYQQTGGSPHKSVSVDLIKSNYADRVKQGVHNASQSPIRSNVGGAFGDSSVVQSIIRREDERGRTNTPYQMRNSFTVAQEPRESATSMRAFTDVKKKEGANVETVISGILKKYNMEKIPDYVGNKNKGATGAGAGVRSPQMQFLSPLLSSPKYESKNASAVNSIHKKDAVAERILSPDVNLGGSRQSFSGIYKQH